MISYFRRTPIHTFILVIFASLIITFIVHVSILNLLGHPLFGAKIIFSYCINLLVACITYVFMFKKRKTHTDMLGYYFLAGSLVKFAIYFIFFNASYKADGIIGSTEFAAFFVPYSVCLIIETASLILLLNKSPS